MMLMIILIFDDVDDNVVNDYDGNDVADDVYVVVDDYDDDDNHDDVKCLSICRSI